MGSVKKAVRTVAAAPKKIVKEVAKAPAAVTKVALSPVEAAAQSTGESLSVLAPGLNAAMPAISQGAAMYATGGMSSAFSGMGGSGMGGLLDNLKSSASRYGFDWLSSKMGINGNAPGSQTMPAEALLGQTNKAISASNAQTASMISDSNKKMMMIGGGVLAAVVAVMYLMKKRR